MLGVVVANCLDELMAKCILITIVIAMKPMKGMTGMGRKQPVATERNRPNAASQCLQNQVRFTLRLEPPRHDQLDQSAPHSPFVEFPHEHQHQDRR